MAFDFSKLEKQQLRHINEFLEDDVTDERYMINIPSMLSRLKDLATPEQVEAAKKKNTVLSKLLIVIVRQSQSVKIVVQMQV